MSNKTITTIPFEDIKFLVDVSLQLSIQTQSDLAQHESANTQVDQICSDYTYNIRRIHRYFSILHQESELQREKDEILKHLKDNFSV